MAGPTSTSASPPNGPRAGSAGLTSPRPAATTTSLISSKNSKPSPALRPASSWAGCVPTRLKPDQVSTIRPSVRGAMTGSPATTENDDEAPTDQPSRDRRADQPAPG